MSKRQLQFVTIASFAALTALVACGGDSAAKVEPAPPAGAPVSADVFRKQQERYADSLINVAKTSKDVVAKLGKGYDVGSLRLRDSLAVLTAKSNCYAQGRQSDPYLAGTVSYFVYMSVVGSNVVRVQQGEWTSAAGNIVEACLNVASKDWRFDTTFGKPASYITQVMLKPETAKPETAKPEAIKDAVAESEAVKPAAGKASAVKPPKQP